MFDEFDIPAPLYVKIFIWVARYLRKTKVGRHIIANFRGRVMLGTISRLHVDAIHEVRRFGISQCSLQIDDYDQLEHLADGCRDVMADVLQVNATDLHCTIKVCQGKDVLPKEEWMVYTIARSSHSNRPTEFGQDYAHLLGHNSAFAAVSGANDRKNNWSTRIYSCFLCDDLKKYETFDCSRENWQLYYQATAVFPLRYRKNGDLGHTILGYLTFDTKNLEIFAGLPCIFKMNDQVEAYEKAISFLSMYHVGGIMADTLAMALEPLFDE